jgi:hypothetical protein
MVNPEREPLSGLVEADETIIPFRTKNDPVVVPAGRSGVGKMLVAGAVEIDGGKPRRARLKMIEGFGKQELHAFVLGAVAPHTQLVTDGVSGVERCALTYPNPVIACGCRCSTRGDCGGRSASSGAEIDGHSKTPLWKVGGAVGAAQRVAIFAAIPRRATGRHRAWRRRRLVRVPAAMGVHCAALPTVHHPRCRHAANPAG